MANNPIPPSRISDAAAQFLEYARVELQFGAQTLEKYEYCLRRLALALGDRPVTEITGSDITGIKSEMLARGNGVCSADRNAGVGQAPAAILPGPPVVAGPGSGCGHDPQTPAARSLLLDAGRSGAIRCRNPPDDIEESAASPGASVPGAGRNPPR